MVLPRKNRRRRRVHTGDTARLPALPKTVSGSDPSSRRPGPHTRAFAHEAGERLSKPTKRRRSERISISSPFTSANRYHTPLLGKILEPRTEKHIADDHQNDRARRYGERRAGPLSNKAG